jgi:hypothetical protein
MRTEDHPVADETGSHDLAHRFTAALAARDAEGLRALFGTHVDFRALTPGRVWEAETPEALVGRVLLGTWFETDDVIERILSAETDRVGPRTRISYRLQVMSAGRRHVVEQQAFLDLADGKIVWLRMLCSGFLPLGEPPAATAPSSPSHPEQGAAS